MATLLLPKWVLHRIMGSMEGKEVRFGSAASAYWSNQYNCYEEWFGKCNARQYDTADWNERNARQ